MEYVLNVLNVKIVLLILNKQNDLLGQSHFILGTHVFSAEIDFVFETVTRVIYHLNQFLPKASDSDLLLEFGHSANSKKSSKRISRKRILLSTDRTIHSGKNSH